MYMRKMSMPTRISTISRCCKALLPESTESCACSEDDGVAAFNDGGDEHDEHDEQGDNGDVYKGGFTHGSDQNAQDLPKHDGDIPENELWRTTDVEALNEDAQKFFEAEKLEDALKRWQRIIEVDPTNVES